MIKLKCHQMHTMDLRKRAPLYVTDHESTTQIAVAPIYTTLDSRMRTSTSKGAILQSHLTRVPVHIPHT